jgi:hypothetical protein
MSAAAGLFYFYCIGALVLSLVGTVELRLGMLDVPTVVAAMRESEPHLPYDEIGMFATAAAPLPGPQSEGASSDR